VALLLLLLSLLITKSFYHYDNAGDNRQIIRYKAVRLWLLFGGCGLVVARMLAP